MRNVRGECIHHWMGMEGETLVYLEYLHHHHLPHVESKNQRLRRLWGKHYYRM